MGQTTITVPGCGPAGEDTHAIVVGRGGAVACRDHPPAVVRRQVMLIPFGLKPDCPCISAFHEVIESLRAYRGRPTSQADDQLTRLLTLGRQVPSTARVLAPLTPYRSGEWSSAAGYRLARRWRRARFKSRGNLRADPYDRRFGPSRFLVPRQSVLWELRARHLALVPAGAQNLRNDEWPKPDVVEGYSRDRVVWDRPALGGPTTDMFKAIELSITSSSVTVDRRQSVDMLAVVRGRGKPGYWNTHDDRRLTGRVNDADGVSLAPVREMADVVEALVCLQLLQQLDDSDKYRQKARERAKTARTGEYLRARTCTTSSAGLTAS